MVLRRQAHVLGGLWLVLMGLACEQSSESGYRSGVLESGLLTVENWGGGTWTDQEAWHLVEEVRLGTRDSEGPEQFSLVIALQVDAGGRIYVLEHLSQEVRVFDAGGAFHYALGGRGRGPGEFVDAVGMAFDPQGLLWVVDPQGGRYSQFDTEGAFLRSEPRRIQGFLQPHPAVFDLGGALVDWGLGFPEEGPEVVAGALVLLQPIRLSPDLQPTDTLPAIEFRQEMIAGGTRPRVFFASKVVVHQDGKGDLWFAHTREYRIFQRSLTGDTVLAVRLDASPARIGQQERDEIRARLEGRGDARIHLEGLPEHKPMIHGVFSDGAGHVFVIPELRDVAAGSVADVFRDTGEYLGRLPLPIPVAVGGVGPVLRATRDHLYYVFTDDYNVPYVAKVRIERPGRGRRVPRGVVLMGNGLLNGGHGG
jgi:hypothetical protein